MAADAGRVPFGRFRDRGERVDHRDDGQEQAAHRGDLANGQNRSEQEVQIRDNLQLDRAKGLRQLVARRKTSHKSAFLPVLHGWCDAALRRYEVTQIVIYC